MLDELCAAMKEIPIAVSYNDDVAEYIAENAYSPEYGARELRRLIQKEIETPIADLVIENYVHPVTSVDLTVLDNALKLNTSEHYKTMCGN
jgi:ATP-dependent Clp protease ATP-binding subunit ClpA